MGICAAPAKRQSVRKTFQDAATADALIIRSPIDI